MMNNTNNVTFEYDSMSRHYIVRNTRILFANFTGAARRFNNEGRRNFHIVIPPEFIPEMEKRGINVHELPPRNDGDAPTYTVKISVYENADIKMVRGGEITEIKVVNGPNKETEDMAPLIDQEFAQGHVLNGHVNVEFHVSTNTQIQNGSNYLRVDVLILPIRKSKLNEELEQMMAQTGFDDDDDDDDLQM